jgi:beta-glucanase (GH16 family)
MRKLHYILILIAMILSTKYIKAQIPVNDPAWVKDTASSDDFNGTTYNGSKWYAWVDSVAGKGKELMLHRNIKVSGGNLSLIVDSLNPNITVGGTTYKYQSGSITSTGNGKFKYGYVEVNAKFPTGHMLYWPAIWYEKDSCTLPNPGSWYNEIDAFENAAYTSVASNQCGSNLHIYKVGQPVDSCSPGTQATDNGAVNTVCCNLQSTFHKYGFYHHPYTISLYFDDILIRTIYDPTNVPKHGLNCIMDIFVTNWVSPDTLPHMPKDSMVVDHFYYYKLNTDCNTNLTISNPTTNYYTASPARAVKKSITTTTVGASSPTFNLTDNCTLRATDYILLDVGTTINSSGTGQFSAIITPCPN